MCSGSCHWRESSEYLRKETKGLSSEKKTGQCSYSSSIFNFLPWKRIVIKFLLTLAKCLASPPPPKKKKKKTQNLCGQNFYSMGYILSFSFPSLQPSPFPDSSCSISRWINYLSRIHVKLYCFKRLKSSCCLLLQPNVAYSDI